MNKEYLPAGIITGAYSFCGEVKISHILDSNEFFSKLTRLFLDSSGNDRLDIESVKDKKNGVAVKFIGVDGEDEAVRLIGKEVFFKKGDINLPEGKFFIDDLINLDVFDAETGDKYGVLSEVTDNGAQQIFRVETQKGYFLVPNVERFIKKISPDEGIFVSLIDGMADDR